MVSGSHSQGRERCLAECTQESFLESVQETLDYQRTGATGVSAVTHPPLLGKGCIVRPWRKPRPCRAPLACTRRMLTSSPCPCTRNAAGSFLRGAGRCRRPGQGQGWQSQEV